ncbi:MurR/RpiR family transcriptional regulator [Mycoplasma capricolum subsp. capricolum]|uniref:MurR/RpiR family transcriptional regulator n=1 Tax=Mycoplasma capricolum TaxID=2095 RepID=UPI0020BE7930|nr:MurR/RpiR family transcriptional regulator [Mycoplasma capricolum]MCK8461455.1 MurR/RpiR family transcriptional regulator [Mycoplasma capricolum subsp. capricolum]
MDAKKVIFKLDQLTKERGTTIGNISKVILNNLELITNLTIYKVADLCFVSPSTITRVCQKYLDISGFSELQILIRVYLNEQEKQDKDEKEGKKISKFTEIKDAINVTDALIDIAEVDKIVRTLYSTKTVALISYDNSVKHAVAELAEKMNLIGIPPVIINQQTDLDYFTKISDLNWLFIVISHFAENSTTFQSISQLKKNGSKIALISMNKQNKYSSVCDYWVKYAVSDDDPLQKIKHSANFSLLYVVQVLFNRILKNDKQRFAKIIKTLKID